MPGIEDLMNIRTQGGTANAPPMGPPPGTGGPSPAMMAADPAMMAADPAMMAADPAMMAGGYGGMGPRDKAPQPDLDGDESLMAPDIEGDSAMLAEAVVNRTGNIQTAVVVLDNAKAMLLASASEQSSPGMGGDPMMAAYGRPLMRRGGGPLYRNEGGSMADSDVLRQMIMDNLQKPEIQEQAMSNAIGQSGRSMSDRDRAAEDLMRFNMA